MRAGIVSDGVSVGVTVVTANQMRDDRISFNSAEATFNAGRKSLSTVYRTFHTAEGNLADWLGVVRTVLAGSFGQRWSTQWAAAGFVNHSTAIPNQMDDRLGLAGGLVGFLTANPTYEVPSLNVTIAYGTTVLTTAEAAQQAVAGAETDLDESNTARDSARTRILGTMGGLIKNLEAKLTANDPRWLAFGLQMPASRVTPAKPQGLTVSFEGPETLLVSCNATPLATRYRFRMRGLDSGLPYQLAASVINPLARITPVAPGTTVEIIVQAVNDGLQGVASDPVVFTLPPANSFERTTKTETSPLAEVEPLAAAAPNGNGTSKANGTTHQHIRA